MKKLVVFLALFLATIQLIFTQKISVVSNVQVPVPTAGCLPVISPSGDFLLLTGGDMQGLQKYDLATKQLSTITNDKGAGFGAKITQDGSKVIFRQSEYKNKLRYTTLKSIDIESGKETKLIEGTRNLQGVGVTDGTVVAIDNGKMATKRVSGKRVSAKDIAPVASIDRGQLFVTEGGKTRQVSPSGDQASYLWASVSPNGKKLLYYVMETAHTYVSNIDGSNPVSLGILRAPVWLGNDWVVGMIDADDGHVVTSSQLFAVSANGKVRETLTDKSVIAMNPSASADASKIAYNTDDGKIFIMTVETSK